VSPLQVNTALFASIFHILFTLSALDPSRSPSKGLLQEESFQ